MCGIAGIVAKSSSDNLRERIHKMTESIYHRGPDSGGNQVYHEQVALGHRRLSILDLRNIANQPMRSSNRNWHIVFNGEIYNYKELKSYLNYNFLTTSDTEVILASIQENGIEWFLSRANGMFAIALYNSETKDLILARDRLGIKPLYYYSDNDSLVFGSEIKSILSSGLVEAKFNYAAVDEYLANRYTREPYTFFKDIFQVRAGSYLHYNNGVLVREVNYWQLPEAFNMSDTFDEESIIDAFEEQLKKAIEYRLISDVPLGTYLSGGVDSSIISALTALKKEGNVNTYTIGFPELNEFKYARMVAEKYGTHHHEILLKKDDYLEQWERLIGFKDAPLGVPNEIPLAIMSSKLKEKITVVLSGEGADELLGGYGRIFRSPFDFNNSKPEKSFYNYFIDLYEYVPRRLRDQFIVTPTEYRIEFDSKFLGETFELNKEESIFRYFHNFHVKGLLQRVDFTTMQTAVEARVPFLDHNLIEFAYREIPYELKLKWKSSEAKRLAQSQKSNVYSERLDIPKYALRKLSYKYLPKEIIERLKIGFPVPLTEWFGDLEILAIEILSKAEWLKKGTLDRLISESKTHARAGQVLWMFINIQIFYNQYFHRNWKW